MTRFGSALRLLPRLARPTCDPADLRAAALRLCAEGRPGLQLAVQEDAHGTTLVVEEDERSCRVHLDDLADAISRDQLDMTPAGLDAALQCWLDRRPVTDVEAAGSGIAVLGWADATERMVAWQVVVHRGDAVVGWVPHPFTPAGDVLAIQAAAVDRAADVVVRSRVEGPVLLLDADDPLLASAACSSPEHVLARAARLGLRLSDARVVVTPGRPVAWAEPQVAARLAGETAEACVTLPWRELAELAWT